MTKAKGIPSREQGFGRGSEFSRTTPKHLPPWETRTRIYILSRALRWVASPYENSLIIGISREGCFKYKLALHHRFAHHSPPDPSDERWRWSEDANGLWCRQTRVPYFVTACLQKFRNAIIVVPHPVRNMLKIFSCSQKKTCTHTDAHTFK